MRHNPIHVCPSCGHVFSPTADESTIGGRMRAARQRQNLTLQQMADRLGDWNPANIAGYERGETPNPGVETIAKFARVLDVDPKWLAFGD